MEGGCMNSTEIYLSVILPCYNEEGNLKRGVLNDVKAFLVEQQYKCEVIVVDDGSTDNSLFLIKKFALQAPVSLLTTHLQVRYFFK